MSRIWRKVQGKLVEGIQFQVDEMAWINSVNPAARRGRGAWVAV